MALTEEQLAALPAGTTNAQALAKNAADLDLLMNGDGLVENRVGELLLSLKEAARRFGYEPPVAFASGIVVSRATQTVVQSGNTYAPDPSLLPFTTTSTFTPSQWLLVATVTLVDASVTLAKLATAVQDLINGALQKSGGTMTGKIVLDGDAALALHPATKQQLDSAVSTINTAIGLRMQYSLTATQTASGLAVDFTGVPSWAKRITIPYIELSTSGTFNPVVQLGSGSYKTTGYAGSQTLMTAGAATSNLASGFQLGGSGAVSIRNGMLMLVHLGGNIWAAFGGAGFSDSSGVSIVLGYVALTGSLDRFRLFAGGTEVFETGTVPALIEG